MASTQPPSFDPTDLRSQGPVPDSAGFPRRAPAHPYYVVAPRYVRTSAGIKALHLLCHCLNRAGLEAHVAIYPGAPEPDRTDPELLTPVLTAATAARHRALGLSPILVYPETVAGNPLGGRTLVRYVLNFPGLLGGDAAYPPGDMVYGYSRVLAEAAGAGPGRVLFVPASDAAVFSPGPPADSPERRGACFWASKYRLVHGAPLRPETEGAAEITRDLPDSPTPREIAALFRRCEVFYAYENTALALEAALCLCPTVFLPNPWLTEAIAAKELGWDGFAWGTDPAEVARARATVHLARERYLATYSGFWDQLAVFARETQARAAEDAARHGGFPSVLARRLAWRPRLEYAAHLGRATLLVLRREGPGSAAHRAARRVGRALRPRLGHVALVARVAADVLRREGLGSVLRRARRRLGGRGGD